MATRYDERGPFSGGGGASSFSQLSGQASTAQIEPGSNGQVLSTVGGVSAWATLLGSQLLNASKYTIAVDGDTTAANTAPLMVVTSQSQVGGGTTLTIPAADAGTASFLLVVAGVASGGEAPMTITPASGTIDAPFSGYVDSEGNTGWRLYAAVGTAWVTVGKYDGPA